MSVYTSMLACFAPRVPAFPAPLWYLDIFVEIVPKQGRAGKERRKYGNIIKKRRMDVMKFDRIIWILSFWDGSLSQSREQSSSRIQH